MYLKQLVVVGQYSEFLIWVIFSKKNRQFLSQKLQLLGKKWVIFIQNMGKKWSTLNQKVGNS